MSSSVERALARIEGAAKLALDGIDRAVRPPAVDSEDRERLALFIALQMTRTTQHRERVLFPKRVVDWASGRTLTLELVEEYLRTEHLGHAPREREAEGAFLYVSEHLKDASVVTPEFAIEMMLKTAGMIAERVLALNWTVEVDGRAEFITSDVPVIPWRKPSRRDHFEGLGIDRAEELRFPLDPGKQLVLSRRSRRARIDVQLHRVRHANADMAGACHRFIVGSPTNGQVDSQYLDRWRPVLRFNVGGPLSVKGPSGKLEEQRGEVLQMWVPRGAGYGPGRRT